MKKLLASAVAAGSICMAVPALADGHSKGDCFDKGALKYTNCDRDKEMYINGYLGYAWADDLESDISILGFPTGITSSRDLKDDIVFGGAIGAYLYGQALRGEVELGFQNFDVDGTTLSGGGGALAVPLEGDVEAMTLMLNLWYDFDTGTRLKPYVGGGVGVGFVDLDTSVPGIPLNIGAIGDSTSLAYQLGAGVSYAATDMIDVGLGYRYRAIDDIDAEGQLLGGLVRYEDAELSSHAVQAEIRVNFYD